MIHVIFLLFTMVFPIWIASVVNNQLVGVRQQPSRSLIDIIHQIMKTFRDSSFHRNRMWSNCPGKQIFIFLFIYFHLSILVTCNGYPQQDENSVGFRLLADERPCVFKRSIAQDTGLILKYYAVPTCQLEPLCRDNYVPLSKRITCQEDGRYDYSRAICLPIV